MLKDFYDRHKNFSYRTSIEYYISPGIRCKFDLIKENIINNRKFLNGIDLGSSGNSVLPYLQNIDHKSYFDIASLPLKQYLNNINWHPLCGDVIRLPYRDKSFDFVSALDILEHVKDDKQAISEISRILKKEGLVMITVPHRMRFYTNQDKLIGHYRRYEKNHLISLFEDSKLKLLKFFGVYGKLMKITNIQSASPDKVEQSIINLREKYQTSIFFRKLWTLIVYILSKLMKLDAKFTHNNQIRNIGLIFIKK